MPQVTPLHQHLYQIALAITPNSALEPLLTQALPAFLEALECSAGAVFLQQADAESPDGYTLAHAVPAGLPQQPVFKAAQARLPAIDQPATLITIDNQVCHIFSLPQTGLLLLVKETPPLPAATRQELSPLLNKLAIACRRARHTEQLTAANQELTHTTARLQEEYDFLRQIIDTSPNFIYTKDRAGRYTLVNKAFADFYQTTPAKLLYKTDADLNFTSQKLAIYAAQDANVFHSGQEAFTPIEKTADIAGHTRWVQTVKRILTLKNGQEQQVLSVGTDVTARKIAEEALKFRVKFDTLITNLSTRFINLAPQQIDNELGHALQALGEFVQVDRSYIFQFSPDMTSFSNTHEWCAPGIPTQIENLQNISADMPTWWMSKINKLETIQLNTLDDLPPEAETERKDFESQNIKSLLVVPIAHARNLIGFIGFDAVSRQRDWSPETVTLLRIVGDIFGNALERKRADENLRDSKERLSSTLASMDDLVFVFDQNGNFTDYYQPEDRQDLYLPAETFLGKSYTDVLPDYLVKPLTKTIENVVETGQVQQIDYSLPVNDEIMRFSAKVSRRRDNNNQFAGVTIVARDITEQYELDKMRENFVSTITHELRTPLTAILGFIETLQSGRPGPLTEVQQRFLNNSYKSAERLLQLIEELLIVSRIQQGGLRLNKKEFLPLQIIKNVEAMLSSLANSRQINLSIEDSWPANQPVYGDPNRLEQVITNLIGNAIKFSTEGQQITVHSMPAPNGWRLTVSDDGIGIPTEETSRLFERFYRASNAAQAQIQGSGLGLYISKAIIEEHSGQIKLASTLGKGTTVWFTIPTHF